MTCVAVRNGVMVADSCILGGDQRLYMKFNKIREVKIKLGKYVLIGVAGAIRDCEDLITTYVKAKGVGTLRPNYISNKANAELLILHENGSIETVSTTGTISEIGIDYWAIGSGENVALGAMAAGASAMEAVKIAEQFVNNVREPYVTGFWDKFGKIVIK